ncbi:hypothetical protein FRC01_007170, partial [Tulasnella sp. 417]
MHHLRRKDNNAMALAVSNNREADQAVNELELLASEIDATDTIVFQTDVGSFWRATSHARLNDTITEEDRDAPPDPDHRKKCIVRKFGPTWRASPFAPWSTSYLLLDFAAVVVIKLCMLKGSSLDGYLAEQVSQPLGLIVELLDRQSNPALSSVFTTLLHARLQYRPPPPPPGVDDADYWGSPLIQVADSLAHNGQLLSVDWHLAGGGFDWREELLEQFDPPDPYEVEEFATAVDVEDIFIGLVRTTAIGGWGRELRLYLTPISLLPRQVSAVAAEKQISNGRKIAATPTRPPFRGKAGPDRFTNDRSENPQLSDRLGGKGKSNKKTLLSPSTTPPTSTLFIFTVCPHPTNNQDITRTHTRSNKTSITRMFTSRSRSRSQSPPALLLNDLPINTRATPRYNSGRRGAVSFFGTAALTGIAFHLLFIGFGGGDAVRAVPVLKEWLPPKPSAVTVVHEACPNSLDPIRTHSTVLPKPTYHPPTSAGSSITSSKGNEHAATVEPEESSDNTASIEELRKMVSQTQGFFGRDFSLGLGWNNMRYIIEAAILQAQLTNRTLVLPSFVYARSCEWEINSCAAFATMVNRGDAIGWGEWRELPIEKQMGWRIPMDTMLDLPHLRKTWPVILVREYLEMHDMDPNKELSNGAWHRTDYLAEKADGSKYTLYNIKNNLYDPKNVIRVDSREPLIQRGIKEDADTGSVGLKLYSAMGSKNSKNVINLDDARKAVGDLMKDRSDDQELQRLLEENGWVVLHTFAAALSIDYHKSVVQPIKQVAPLRWVKGWQDDYKNTDTDILLLEGETHLGRKPGGMRFSTEATRDDFARTVLYGMRPIDK